MITLKIFRGNSSGNYSECGSYNVSPGRLSDLLRKLHIDIPFECGGRGTCGKCAVRLLKESDPRFQEWDKLKTPPADEIRNILSPVPACRTFLEESAFVFTETDSIPSEPVIPFHFPDETAEDLPDYGFAVDLGTTSIAALLVNLKTGKTTPSLTAWNPQKIYGADLISRLAAIAGNPEKAEECRLLTCGAITDLLRRLSAAAQIPLSQIKKGTVAGNSLMSHFFLGIEPTPITLPPYEPAVLSFPPISAESAEIPIAPNAEIITLPILTNLIGGDLTAGIFTLETDSAFNFQFGKSGPELLADIGTNGELLLFTDDKIYAAQTAAGPVFEGAEISSGMRAEPGAVVHLHINGTAPLIDGCVINTNRILLETVGNLPPAGLAGSGLIDLAAELLRTGDLLPSGKLRGKIEIAPGIEFTQKDVRALQLAVGAIRGGMNVLLETAGFSWNQLTSFYAAGGLGCGVNPESARRIGLFPPELDLCRFTPCGNSSLTGAVAGLLRSELLNTISDIRKRTVHIPLGGNKRFEEEFVKRMIFPNPK